ncbi:MAG: peptidoglycan DD-metalloendopeptidase family protein [bacterium]|nr:peptidoglycan DD-metalloendopeptidase family protein [bacterium]
MRKQNKNYQKGLLLAALLCGSVLFSALAYAEETSIGTQLTDAQKKALENKQDQIDAINAKIKAYNQIITLKQRQGSTLADQIRSLEAQASKLQLEIDLNKQKLGNLEGDIAGLSSRIVEKESLMQSQKQMLSELMRLYYSDYSNTAATLIYSSDETFSFLSKENWTTQVSGKIGELLDSVKTLRESLVGERVTLEDKKKEADTLHIQLIERDEYLESTKDNKAYLLTKTQAEVDKYDTLVDDLQKQRDEIESEIEELEAGKLDGLNLKDMPAFKKGLFAYPLKKFTVSQGYGKTSFSKKAYKSGKHNGIDFAAPTGTSIYAPLGGKVVGVGNNGRYAYGKWVAIDHGNGIITLYGHMSSQSVSKGEKVDAGEKIGAVGSTGYSTGPHVHFSVFSAKSFELVQSKVVKNLWIPIGATVNPSVYLP